MDTKNANAPRKSRSVREIIDQANDLWKIAKIAIKMTEEERADFFDWWNYSRFENASAVDDATKHIRKLARKIKKTVL